MMILDDDAMVALADLIVGIERLGLRAFAIPEPPHEARITLAVIRDMNAQLQLFGRHWSRCDEAYNQPRGSA